VSNYSTALDNLHTQIADLKAQAATSHERGLSEFAVRQNARAVTLEIAADRIEMAAEGFTRNEIAQYIARTYGQVA
jgi:hypothetical protein